MSNPSTRDGSKYFSVYVAEHEHHDALEAYGHLLSDEQKEQIREHEGPLYLRIYPLSHRSTKVDLL